LTVSELARPWVSGRDCGTGATVLEATAFFNALRLREFLLSSDLHNSLNYNELVELGRIDATVGLQIRIA